MDPRLNLAFSVDQATSEIVGAFKFRSGNNRWAAVGFSPVSPAKMTASGGASTVLAGGGSGVVSSYRMVSTSSGDWTGDTSFASGGGPSYMDVDGVATVAFRRKLANIQDASSLDLVWALGSEAIASAGSPPLVPHSGTDRAGILVDALACSSAAVVASVPAEPFLLAYAAPMGTLLVVATAFFRLPGLRFSAPARCCYFRRVGAPPPRKPKGCASACLARVPGRPALLDLTLGQLLVVAVFMISCVLFVMAYANQATNTFPVTSAFGWLTTLSLALVTLPVNRSSTWIHLLGLPFERALVMHRIVGRVCFLSCLFHLCMAAWRHGAKVLTSAKELRDGIVPLHGFLAFLSMLLLVATALNWFRRKKFEAFFYVHRIFFLVFLFAVLHNPHMAHRLLLVLPLLSYLLPWLMSWCKHSNAKLKSARVIRGALRLEVP